MQFGQCPSTIRFRGKNNQENKQANKYGFLNGSLDKDEKYIAPALNNDKLKKFDSKNPQRSQEAPEQKKSEWVSKERVTVFRLDMAAIG